LSTGSAQSYTETQATENTPRTARACLSHRCLLLLQRDTIQLCFAGKTM